MSEYLSVNVSDEIAIETIKSHIKNRTPFCLSRIGDGEIYLINNNAPQILIDKICLLWNIKISDYQKFRQDLVNQVLIPTITKSDMLGLLNPNNPICNTLKYKKQNWSLLKDASNKDLKICDHQITRGKILGDINEFKNILNGRSLTIISPNEQLKNQNLSQILETEVLIDIVSNDRLKLLQTLNKIRTDVIIFGTSLTGKDIGIRLRDMGKICLDFGATLDAWAGLESRKWFSNGGLQSHCLIKTND